LNYCIEAEAHARDFPVQSIPLVIRKLLGEQSLDLAYRIAKLAVLISVGQSAKLL
jgi:hypothetical protein